ncbi:MAG TPA: class I SAM-dependent methyltransferase [bacterium]|nr:class I SAM-dependent methyltransferase [bacterium]
MDPIASFKEAQRNGWASFIPFEIVTTTAAARLVSFAGVAKGQRVLDVGCGTGVVAVTAAQRGAEVVGLDLTPQLLVRAKENAQIAGMKITFEEGDCEALPFPDASFDAVLSQFGHMFAPRPDVAVKEMLRVLKPGGVIAFSTWPPELMTGRMFAMIATYLPPPPPGIAAPPQWGDVGIVRERLGSAVTGLRFDRGTMPAPAMSPEHFRDFAERFAAPVQRAMGSLKDEPAKLARFRKEFDELIREYFTDNFVRQDFLMTRAIKA